MTTRADTGEVGLDEVDHQLIALLRGAPRATYSELASEVHLSSVAVATRVNRLRNHGAILIGAILEPQRFGSGTAAAVLVEVDRSASTIATALATIREVTFVAHTSGRFAIQIEIRCAHNDDLIRVLDHLRQLDGVTALNLLTYLDVAKEYSSPPRSSAPTKFDEMDRQLISLLQEDGRVTFARLAESVGVSRSTVTARVNRLLESGVIVIVTTAAAWASPHVSEAAFLCTLVGDAESVARRFVGLPGITFVACTTGTCDLAATCSVASRQELIELAGLIRTDPGVTRVEMIEYLRIVKEDYRQVPNNPTLEHEPMTSVAKRGNLT